jgi:hypothetical protein
MGGGRVSARAEVRRRKGMGGGVSVFRPKAAFQCYVCESCDIYSKTKQK